jgi:hypothetical protein
MLFARGWRPACFRLATQRISDHRQLLDLPVMVTDSRKRGSQLPQDLPGLENRAEGKEAVVFFEIRK